MTRLFGFFFLVAFAVADVSHLFLKNPPLPVALVPHSGQVFAILKSNDNINPDGSYEYAFDTENGITVHQFGEQKTIGSQIGNTAHGGYQYTSPEGQPIAVHYVADENGFQPESNALPTPPPIPPQILKALEWNINHPEPSQYDRVKRSKMYY